MDDQEEKEKIIQDLLKKRSGFIGIKAKIAQLIEPRVFQLQLENISNVRNSIIISGALATIGLLVITQQISSFSILARSSLQVSITGFLFTILTYSFYLDRILGKGITQYRKKIEENTATAEKGENLVNECLDGHITKDEADEKLVEIYKEIEFERIRVKPKSDSDKDVVTKYLAIIGNIFFIGAIILLIFSFIYEVFCI